MTGQARVLRADRSQPSWDLIDLEALLPADHRARVVWSFVGALDLSPFYAAIGSREGELALTAPRSSGSAGALARATLEGVGSARQLDRLVTQDMAYRWLAGGVPVNYHGLSDFRVGWAMELDRLLTESVTALVSEGIVDLTEIAIDGTKVRAPASKRSFTRGGRLDRIEQAARQRIERLKQEVESDPAGGQKRRHAAQERAAREAEAKVAKARAALERLRKEKQARAKNHGKAEAAKDEPSTSLSDPEVRRIALCGWRGARRLQHTNRGPAQMRAHRRAESDRPAQRHRPCLADGRKPLRAVTGAYPSGSCWTRATRSKTISSPWPAIRWVRSPSICRRPPSGRSKSSNPKACEGGNTTGGANRKP